MRCWPSFSCLSSEPSASSGRTRTTCAPPSQFGAVTVRIGTCVVSNFCLGVQRVVALTTDDHLVLSRRRLWGKRKLQAMQAVIREELFDVDRALCPAQIVHLLL